MNPVRPEEIPPLENPVILEVLFEHCNVADLKACRQVSKVWRDTSLKAWRSLVGVVFGVNGRTMMAEFLEFVQNENSNHLENPFVTNYVMSEQNQEFWDLCGFSVKTLALRGTDFQSADVLRNVIFSSCPNLEHLTIGIPEVLEGITGVTEEPAEFMSPQFGEHIKLKSLTLVDARDGNEMEVARDRSYPVSWMELLSYFPFLETLNVNGDLKNCAGLFRSLALIREHDQRKLRLKHVQTSCAVYSSNPPSLFSALQDSRLRLISLQLCVRNHKDAIEIQEILRIHASSLKKLTLCSRTSLEAINCFPFHSQLVNLEEIELVLFTGLTIDFFKYTPNLRKLTIFGDFIRYGNRMNMSEITDVSLTKCKVLEINGFNIDDDVLAENLRIIAKGMPNLVNLKIHCLGNGGFAALCEVWPNLVSLTLDDCGVDDGGITGLDPEDVARINEEGENGTWRPITVPRSNITALEGLQTFHLMSRPTVSELGVSSARCGILQLSQLRHLRVELYVFQADWSVRVEPQNPTLWKAVTDRLGI